MSDGPWTLFLVLFWCGANLLGGCTSRPAEFYKDRMVDSDVWRLPIVEPYQLLTADCSAADSCRGWSFQYKGNLLIFSPDSTKYVQHRGILAVFNPDSINYVGGTILFFEHFNGYRSFDTKNKKAAYYRNEADFNASLVDKGLVRPRLYSTDKTYNFWNKTGQLPWASELLADWSRRNGR